jgi:hypothetical protein
LVEPAPLSRALQCGGEVTHCRFKNSVLIVDDVRSLLCETENAGDDVRSPRLQPRATRDNVRSLILRGSSPSNPGLLTSSSMIASVFISEIFFGPRVASYATVRFKATTSAPYSER